MSEKEPKGGIPADELILAVGMSILGGILTIAALAGMVWTAKFLFLNWRM